MNQSSTTTQKRILDAAESLYGSSGVGATSLRAIVRKANVNLNAVNYHFGSKDLVTARLFESIMAPINEERNQLLDKLTGIDPTVRQLVHAAYWPVFRRAVGSKEGRRRIAIVNQVRQDPAPTARALVQQNLEAFVPQFEEQLMKATGHSKSRLAVPVRLMIATAWGLVSQSMVLDELAYKKSNQTQQRLFARFLDYTTAGFHCLTNR